ncbi:MAG: hypothetical protein JO043_05490, partial [Candidatus Eremiobacteraeota bacterium]|nr:hypothetical protein [Candidatus Eremiobacteraeota bacterium]
MRKTLTAALFLTLLSGCNGSNSVPPPATSTGIDTDFVVQGRYIMESEAPASTSAASLRVRPASLGAAKKFYIKGLVYWPTPIGKNVADAPMLNNALNDGNAAVWKRDLPLMRALGANAIHVYNVTPPGFDEKTGPITNFLTAAWNGGQNPIYVLMSIHFNGDALLNSGAVSSLAQQYHDLDMKYAKYPAVFGVTISNEIGANNFITNQQWWNGFNTVARAAKQGFADGGDANKIVTTSEPDGLIGFVKAGEKFGAAVDAWGINIYRGRTFTGLFEQLKATTNKPTMLTEYGAPA